MADEPQDNSFNARMDRVNDVIDSDPELKEAAANTNANALDPASTGNTEPSNKNAIGEDPNKTSDADKVKPQDNTPAAIEPPTSWPTDDKEAFKSLPAWAQETIVRRDNEKEAFFSERSRTLAARETEIQTIQTRAQQDQQRYVGELQRLNQMATQLMPAKFSDIASEADYLRLKVEDPARASEYEAFVQVLRNSQAQQAQVMQAQQKAHLDKEWSQLQTKYPEFKDPVKGVNLLNDVRKAAMDYYGFSQQEVEIIADHRHVPIIRDALAWRNHLANLKAAEGKKVPNTPNQPALRANAAGNGANMSTEVKSKTLTRAGKETDLRKKADLLASLIT